MYVHVCSFIPIWIIEGYRVDHVLVSLQGEKLLPTGSLPYLAGPVVASRDKTTCKQTENYLNRRYTIIDLGALQYTGKCIIFVVQRQCTYSNYSCDHGCSTITVIDKGQRICFKFCFSI